MVAARIRSAYKGGLREFASEITERTPPLQNIRFTNRYIAAFLGGAVLNWAADAESLASMRDMGVDEATNWVGALLTRVSRPFLLLIFLHFLFSYLPLSFFLCSVHCQLSLSGGRGTGCY